jgi:hypothetical protein
MKPLQTVYLVLVVDVLSLSLTAQPVQNAVPLKNWPAPMYWQASQDETRVATGKGGAEFGRAVSPAAASTTTSSPLVFVAMTPCRVVDTRTSQMFAAPFGPPGLSSGGSRSFPIQSSSLCPTPAGAQAYSFNVTLIPPGSLGYPVRKCGPRSWRTKTAAASQFRLGGSRRASNDSHGLF